MRILRALMVLATVFALLTLTSPAALADPGPGGDSSSLPTGFPAGLRQYVAGTAEFKAAPWSAACAAGGRSTTPARIGSSQITNQGATSGGVDVGMYLSALAPHLNELGWWALTDDGRREAWKNHILMAPNDSYPGDAKAASTTPDWLPTSPALITGSGPNYPTGFCSTEMTGWGNTGSGNGAGVNYSSSIDDTSSTWVIDHAAQLGPWGHNANYLRLGAQDCKDSDKGAFCSIAYYVDCSNTGSDAALASCATWNAAVYGEIHRDTAYVDRKQGVLDKVNDFFSNITGGVAGVLAGISSFFSSIYHAAAAIVDFIKDPAGEFDKFVNELKQDAISLCTAVLQGYNSASTFDPRSGGFIDHYAVMMGLGLVLCAFMFLGALRSAQDNRDREKAKGIARRLALTIGLMPWAPLLFCWLADGVNTGTTSIVSNWTGGALGNAVAKLGALNQVTSSIPGGAIAGFIVFLAMIVGAFALWVGLQVQRFGLEVSATLLALVMGVYVHPRFAGKVSKFFWVIIGLFLAKPMTMIVLGAALNIIADNVSLTGSPSQVLGGMTLAAVGMVICGFTPFALLKWAPILPTGAGSHDHSAGGAAISAAVIGSAGNSLASAARGSGSQPAGAAGTVGGEGGGGSQPTELESKVSNRPTGNAHLAKPAADPSAAETGASTVIGSANSAAAAGGQGAAAAGAGKAAASAGAAVGTAGVSAAVQMASTVASTAAGKAKTLGHGHVPEADMDEGD